MHTNTALLIRSSKLAPLALLAIAGAAAADQLPLASGSPEADAWFGQSVALIGDLDGDGIADVVVGAPQETAAGLQHAGAAYVYSGRTGALLRSHTSPAAESFGLFGHAVIGFGDADGDGYGDYAVGAPGQGSSDKGHLYAFSGADGSLLWEKAGVGLAPGWGGQLALLPDASGDGLPEILVGHVGAAGSPPSVSAFRVQNGEIWKTYTKPVGGGAFHRFGQAIAGSADITGDGFGDVIVGAPSFDLTGGVDAGAVFVYDGATGAYVSGLTSVDLQPSGAFGASVAGIPDFDGDGVPDLAVGAPNEIPGGSTVRSGQVHFYSGLTLMHVRTQGSPAPVEQGIFGYALAGAADLNGDGRGDLLVGAPLEGAGASLGRVYRISGASGAALGEPFTSPQTAGFGMSLSAAADVTHDGRPDVAVGAPMTQAGGDLNVGGAVLLRLVYNDGCTWWDQVPQISEGWHFVTNIGATDSPEAPTDQACTDAGEDSFKADVFFEYAPSGNGVATISTCLQEGFDTRLAVYAEGNPGAVCDLSDLLACSDDAPGCADGGSTVSLPVTQNGRYLIRIGGTLGEQGTTGLIIELDATCSGDLDGNGLVDGADLGILLGEWGTTGIADLNADDVVDGADLGILLGAWGACA